MRSVWRNKLKVPVVEPVKWLYQLPVAAFVCMLLSAAHVVVACRWVCCSLHLHQSSKTFCSGSRPTGTSGVQTRWDLQLETLSFWTPFSLPWSRFSLFVFYLNYIQCRKTLTDQYSNRVRAGRLLIRSDPPVCTSNYPWYWMSVTA